MLQPIFDQKYDVIHVVHSRFNYQCFPGMEEAVRSPVWLEHRLEIYSSYTVASILRQTTYKKTPTYLWLDCRPGSEEELAPFLDELPKEVNVTFDGGIEFLNRIADQHGDKFYVVTRLDSDDTYLPQAMSQIEAVHRGGIRFSQFQRGPTIEVATGREGEHANVSGPFYSVTYLQEELRTGKQVPLQIGNEYGHSVFRRLYEPVVLPDGLYRVIRHGRNTT